MFFRQRRVGRDGTRFQMLKFRTMVAGADAHEGALRAPQRGAEGLFKIADDPRVTRVGRFLRRTSLDELPQLLTSSRGEMSLVGPRPLVIEEDAQSRAGTARRLDLMPGHDRPVAGPRPRAGPAAARWSRSTTSTSPNWSLWTDIKILLRTVPHVLGRGHWTGNTTPPIALPWGPMADPAQAFEARLGAYAATLVENGQDQLAAHAVRIARFEPVADEAEFGLRLRQAARRAAAHARWRPASGPRATSGPAWPCRRCSRGA